MRYPGLCVHNALENTLKINGGEINTIRSKSPLREGCNVLRFVSWGGKPGRLCAWDGPCCSGLLSAGGSGDRYLGGAPPSGTQSCETVLHPFSCRRPAPGPPGGRRPGVPGSCLCTPALVRTGWVTGRGQTAPTQDRLQLGPVSPAHGAGGRRRTLQNYHLSTG